MLFTDFKLIKQNPNGYKYRFIKYLLEKKLAKKSKLTFTDT